MLTPPAPPRPPLFNSNLPLYAVGVPELVAKIMTYPERVTSTNLSTLSQAVMNGAEKYPGANSIRLSTGLVKSLRFSGSQLVKLAQELRVGDIVERHMVDGDVVLFNRQPSLHKCVCSYSCHPRVCALPFLPYPTLRSSAAPLPGCRSWPIARKFYPAERSVSTNACALLTMRTLTGTK